MCLIITFMEIQKLFFFSFYFFLFSLIAGYEGVQGSSHHHHHRNHGNLYGLRPQKLFVFGDSYADTGNNRKTEATSWKDPYGITFPGKPAGRFSNGRVLTDYLARFVGVKSPVPYRWRNYAGKRLRNGMNFAYGGTGVFKTLVMDPNMTTQIHFFEKLIKESVYTKRDLQSSVALVSLAGNDYAAFHAKGGNDLGLPFFIPKVIDQLALNLKRIHGLGVRKVAVTGLEPLGCLPRTTVKSSFRQCNGTENIAVSLHNALLQQAVRKLNSYSIKDSAFIILDLYSSFISVLKNETDHPGSLKFETPLKPCCMGISNKYSCGRVEKGVKMYTVCDNPESAFFWDTVHPTQAGWRAVYLALQASLEQIF